jgi:hypothetical protein
MRSTDPSNPCNDERWISDTMDSMFITCPTGRFIVIYGHTDESANKFSISGLTHIIQSNNCMIVKCEDKEPYGWGDMTDEEAFYLIDRVLFYDKNDTRLRVTLTNLTVPKYKKSEVLELILEAKTNTLTLGDADSLAEYLTEKLNSKEATQ